MEPDLFQKNLEAYIAYQKAQLDNLSGFRSSDYERIDFSCAEISDSFYDDCVNTLIKSGISKSDPVLYYFKITGNTDGKVIQDKITMMKRSPGRSSRALPKVNSGNYTPGNDTLYAGKKEYNFFSRFKQHLGLSSQSVYALHLDAWAMELNIDVELHYMRCRSYINQPSLLEQAEHVLHFSLKPLLGRPGH